MTKGRSTERGSSKSQNQEVRKILNATTMARRSTARRIVGTKRRVETLSHLILKGMWQVPQIMVKFYTMRQQGRSEVESSFLTSDY